MTKPDQMMDKMPLLNISNEQMSKAVINTAWFNRDTPEDIPDMLDALGLKEHAAKMRRTA